ncbi:hypothetical protein K501DRAFT_285687 [Backusella circina FSU 941]|nr:hypothetical protein K501DRAFT_289554 [Backusella circina FSU 941]KAI8882743.1 hypothetical protein K501DRAFT_285687 [Backusella circina FSU 941]
MLSSSKYIVLFLIALLSLFQFSSAAETLCRTCGREGVFYTYDSPYGHFEAYSRGAACLHRTMARSVDGAVFQDQGNHIFTVSGRGWVRSCTITDLSNPCCTAI